MSYSFSVTGKSKQDVMDAATAKFDELTGTQSAHAKDKDLALSHAGAIVAALPDNVAIALSMNGSISTDGERVQQLAANAWATVVAAA